MSEDKNISGMIEVGVDEGNAKIEGKVITLPASFVGTTVGVFYEYETDSAVKLVDSAESFAEAAMYVVDILAADVCNPSVKRAGKIVFPKAKIDNNFTVNLTTGRYAPLLLHCSEGLLRRRRGAVLHPL